jgi:hypothetical protein
MKMVVRQLRQLRDGMEPGPMRDQLTADLTCLKVRLLALPSRVGAHWPCDAEELRAVIDRELRAAFSDVAKWM